MRKGQKLTPAQRTKALTALRLGSKLRWTQTTSERFWSKVAFADEDQCWSWTASRQGEYGQFYFEGRPIKASRAAWLLIHGVIPDGLEVLHECDNPICVNPKHLSIGTHAKNLGDAKARGRMARGESHYLAKLTVTQVREIRERYANGERLFQLAARFNVHRMVIKNVVMRNTWSHVDDQELIDDETTRRRLIAQTPREQLPLIKDES